MASKHVRAEMQNDYVVRTETEGFTYTLDYNKQADPDYNLEGASPTSLVLASLAGCYGMTTRSFLLNQSLNIEKIQIDIRADFNFIKPKWAMTSRAKIILEGQLSPENEEALEAFINRHCTVSGVLKGNPQNDLSFVIECVDAI